MLDYKKLVYLIHIIFVGPILIYVGYYKNKVDKIVKDAEEGLKKENIKDHERYILDQKIEVLNSIKSN